MLLLLHLKSLPQALLYFKCSHNATTLKPFWGYSQEWQHTSLLKHQVSAASGKWLLGASSQHQNPSAEHHTIHVSTEAAVGGRGLHRHTLTFDSKMSELTRSHFPSVSDCNAQLCPALWLQQQHRLLGWAVIHWPPEMLQQTMPILPAPMTCSQRQALRCRTTGDRLLLGDIRMASPGTG